MLARLLLACSCLLALAGAARADTCTLVTELETGRVLKREGDCERRSSPASTFKVPLSLMGYDAGILEDESKPVWRYAIRYGDWWKRDKVTDSNPTTWLSESLVWYSQILTREMGEEQLKSYVDAFGYSNRNIRGDTGKNNGLTYAWLSSSLQISPVEQIGFLRRLLKRELPVSAKAYDMTLAVMPTFPLSDGWTAYAKTGSGFQPSPNGSPNRDRQFGWFVGWAQKGESRILFARLIRDERKETSVASFRARDSLLADLPALIAD